MGRFMRKYRLLATLLGCATITSSLLFNLPMTTLAENSSGAIEAEVSEENVDASNESETDGSKESENSIDESSESADAAETEESSEEATAENSEDSEDESESDKNETESDESSTDKDADDKATDEANENSEDESEDADSNDSKETDEDESENADSKESEEASDEDESETDEEDADSESSGSEEADESEDLDIPPDLWDDEYYWDVEDDGTEYYISYDYVDVDDLELLGANEIQITASLFPDEAFRKYVSKNLDLNGDGSLSGGEISMATSIDVSQTASTQNKSGISSLKGIEVFTRLEYLYCSYNKLTSLDLSKNERLAWIHCDHNQLTSLSLSANKYVTYLNCSNNKLTSLDISANDRLIGLDCSVNSLTSLNLKNKAYMTECYVGQNALKSVDVSSSTLLDVLDISNNQLTSLSVTKNKALTTLYYYGNQIRNVDLNSCPILKATMAEKKIETLTDPSTGIKYYFYYSANANDEFEGIKLNAPDTGLPFVDVFKSDWFYDAIVFVYNNGLMTGKSEGRFYPTDIITRSEFVTVLYNREKRPSASYVNQFSDVPKNKWFSIPVSWAYKQKITVGYGDKFGVTDVITREQMAKMLFDYAKMKGYDQSYSKKALNNFPDASSVSSYATEAMQWAVSKKIINGKGTASSAKLDPQGKASRAECAQMMINMKNAFK